MIVSLNGCSSSGKTSIAKAIQHLSDVPWLLLGIDACLDMMPAKYIGMGEKAHEGFHFVSREDPQGPVTRIEMGPVGKAVSRSMAHIAQTLTRDGHHLIVDEVLLSDEELETYRQVLKGQTVYFVGVMCELDALLERETLREDRASGLARDQFAHTHHRILPYDLTVDTTSSSVFECARTILSFMEKTPRPLSFSA